MINKLEGIITNTKPDSVYKLSGYTLQDLLSNFYKYINECIEQVNKNEEHILTQNELMKKFIEYMKKEGIPPIVIETINEMYNDGRLTEIIDNLGVNLTSKINEFTTEINNKVQGLELEFKNGLKSKIDISEDVFIEGVQIEKKRDEISNTTYHVVIIPTHDKDGNFIKLKTGVSEYYETNPNRHESDGTGSNYHNNPKLETARHFSQRKNATLVINGGTWGDQGANGNCVVNGEIKASASELYKRMPLGIKADNTLTSYNYTDSAQQNLDDGSIDVVPGFYPIMVNGTKYSGSLTFDWEGKNPRTFIGQRPNKEIVIIVCSGRHKNEDGMSMNDGFRLLSDYQCTFGYNLDGGGSSSLVYRNEYLNEKIDFNRKQERRIYNFIYIAKEKPKSKLSEEIINTTISIGDLRSLIYDTITDLFNIQDINAGYLRLKGEVGYEYQGVESWDGDNKNTKLILHKDYLRYYDYSNSRGMFYVGKEGDITTPKGTLGIFNSTPKTVTDIDNLNESGLFWSGKDVVNAPNQTSNGILNFYINDNNKMQVAFPFSTDNVSYKMKIRRTNSADGSWYEWKEF